MILFTALPALGAVLALVVLAILSRRIAAELSRLRRSLRQLGATAVAADELRRSGAEVTNRAVTAREQVGLRVRLPRPAGRRHPR